MTALLRTEEPVPAEGQLVVVRGRHWVVTYVEPTALPLDIAASTAGEGHTLVSLSSVEDDATNETLRVLWEIEPGVQIREQATLPDLSEGRFDDPSTLGAFLDALRWGALTNAETTILQAPFRAGIAVEEHQLDPLIRAVSMPRANLLIADDVGLGKTIEAGLVIQELLLRHRARRVMVVCPAPLCEKWREEMANRFGLDFSVVNSEELRQVRRARGLHANPFKVHPYTIVSLSWLREARCQRLLAEAFGSGERFPRPLDILVVDEAHHCAPAGKGKYAIDSRQTRAVAALTKQAEHRLFLSATPHNGYAESWTALLEMLDAQRFARGVTPDPVALKQVLVRRLKSTILNPDGSRRFPDREVVELAVDYPAQELEVHRLLVDYTAARAKRLTGRKPGVKKACDLSTLLLKKRLFSSPAAFTRTLRQHAIGARGLGTPDLQFPAEGIDIEWASDAHVSLIHDDWEDDAAFDETENEVVAVATRAAGKPEPRELELLDKLLSWADEHGLDSDAKAQRLIAWLKDTLLTSDGAWSEERVVIFTEYRDTQRWLAELLDQHDLAGSALGLLYGGMDDDAREKLKDEFQKPPALHPIRILLATDTASEGIDLQRHCRLLVNYDVPFNPNRLEQRAGRIDRYGQNRIPQVFHFVGSHWQQAAAESYDGDLEFLTRVALKVHAMREDLGSVNPVLSDQVERRMVGRPDLTFRLDEVQPKKVVKDLLKAEHQLREDAERLRATLQSSADTLHAAPADAQRVVEVALALDHQAPLEPAPDAESGGTVYRVGAVTGAWARATAGLVDADYGHRPVSFDAGVAATRQDLVLAHLNHPMVALATRLLRAEVWGHGHLARATSLVVDDPDVTEEVLAVYSRLVLLGTDGSRVHEELFPAGGRLRGGTFARLRVGELDRALNAALGPGKALVPTDKSTRVRLSKLWPRLQDGLHSAVQARAADREQSLRKTLERRRDDEASRLEALLGQFQANLRAAVDAAGGAEQMSFADLEADERTQLEQDTEALRQRLASLPKEQEAELAAVRARYAQVDVRWFPAAVVHLVPAGANRS